MKKMKHFLSLALLTLVLIDQPYTECDQTLNGLTDCRTQELYYETFHGAFVGHAEHRVRVLTRDGKVQYQEDDWTRRPVAELATQKITIQMYWPNTHKVAFFYKQIPGKDYMEKVKGVNHYEGQPIDEVFS